MGAFSQNSTAQELFPGGFSFGASQPAASQPAAPAFSFNAGVPTPAAPRLDFAQPSASPFGAAPPAAPTFAFGGPMAAPAAPQAASFQFGASAPNQGGVFRFGAPSQASGALSPPSGKVMTCLGDHHLHA